MDMDVLIAQPRAAATDSNRQSHHYSLTSSVDPYTETNSKTIPRSRLAQFVSTMSSKTSRDNTDTELPHTISGEDIDASISILQANTHHKKRVGEIQYSDGQILAFRPGPTTRKEIRGLQSRLEGL